MTDNEIIKVLKRCGRKHNEKNDTYCKECQFKSYLPCVAFLCDRTIDLIKRQKAEIESLKHRKTELQIRNQELQHEKSEAIKEFAERLKCGVPQETGVIRCADVDTLVKEMTEVSE